MCAVKHRPLGRGGCQEKRVDKQDTYVRYYYPITDEISIFKDIIKYKDDLNG